MFCKQCGTKLADNAVFCKECGTKTKNDGQQLQNDEQKTTMAVAQPPAQPPPPPAAQNITPPPQQYSPQQQIQQYPQPAKKKKSGGLVALLVAVPLVIVLVAGGLGVYFFVLNKPSTDPNDDTVQAGLNVNKSTTETENNNNPSSPTSESNEIKNPTEPTGNIELPFVSYTYMDKKPEAVIGFATVDSIFPSNYRTMDAIVTFTGYSDYGNLDVLIEVEIPGFTQVYKQKVQLGRQVTKLRIIPPLVTGSIDLNSEKMAQIVYSVTEVDTGKLLVQESKNIKLYSKFDMIWGDEFDGDAYTDNILAWMTPDAPEILQLKRDAIDYLSYISEGAIDSLLGYQDYNFFDHYYYNTWVQAVAIQGAMSDITQIRYNNSWFSMDAQQRVKLPADTISSRSGLCIETALVMASALQSAGMHVMLIFPPGHAQVAVEAWYNEGEYFLIETTVLPMAQDMDGWDSAIVYLDKDEWYAYITGAPCYVVDCDLGEKLGIRAMSN
jgi:hypothetical protein